MPAALKLMRLGKKHKPFYRVVAVDKRKKRNSRYLEVVGIYNPEIKPTKLEIDWIKFDSWKKKGAVISEGLERLIKSQKLLKKD